MVRARRTLVVCAVVLAGVALTAPWVAGQIRESRLARSAPALDPEMLRHIATDSDRAWYAYCRGAGNEARGAALRALLAALDSADRPGFERIRGPVEAALLRIGGAFREIHGIDALERRTCRDVTLSDALDFQLHQWERRVYELASDTSGTLESRALELDRLALRFMASGDSGRALFATAGAAYCQVDRERYEARLRAAIRLARDLEEHNMVCQMLGDLGVAHRYAGREDSMRACYDEGIELARSHELIDQAARILRFYASFYVERGQLAMALDRLTEALRLADGPGGDAAQPRSQIEYSSFLASLGCWDLADRSLRRVPPLLRKLSSPGLAASRLRYAFDADLLRARLAFATGRVDEGNRRMRELSASAPPGARRAGLATIYEQWSIGLEKAGRMPEALEICRRGLAYCDTAHVPERVPRLLLRAARAEASQGRRDAARAFLDSVRTLEPNAARGSPIRFEADVLQARLSFLGGRRALARRQIERTYRALQAHWRDPGGGTLGNLEPVDDGALRDAIHEIEPFTPEQGYDFEMEWRSIGRLGSPPASGPAETFAGLSSSRRTRPLRPAGTHLVYRFAGSALVRWVADSGGVVVDTIPLSAERCLAEVRAALEVLQSEPAEPGSYLGASTFYRLRGLSELLLPPTLAVSADRPRRVHITPDGPLCALPFEALPFPPSAGSPPLAMTADVDYLRGWNHRRPKDSGDVVIVSNPLVPAEIALRYEWTGNLRQSEAETRDALGRWPRAAVFTGAGATKASIRATWPEASVIYLAAHHVRDPDAPILGFVPLSAPPGAPPDASVLESADVRSFDLSACRLAVLATCSSGAPYRSAVRPGPSLGDAFLDSGTASVVCSFWDVGDAEARDFMRVFLSTWRPDQPDAVSLGRARREMMASPQGAPPRMWAVWSVQTALTR